MEDIVEQKSCSSDSDLQLSHSAKETPIASEGSRQSDQALMENSNLNFVKPAWIYAINERQKMLPYQPYTVVP